MQDERRHRDAREHLAQVGAEVQLQEDRGGLGGRGRSLHARVVRDLVARGVRVEEPGEHLRAEPPVRADERDQRRLRRLRDVVARRVTAEVDDLLGRAGPPHRELRRGEAAARGGEDDGAPADRVDHRLELAALRLDRRPRVELARGETAADAVEAHDLVGACELGVERPLVGVGPLLLEMGDPARPDDDRRPLAVGRVGEAPPLEVEVADLLLHHAKRSGPDGPSRKDGPSGRRGRPWPIGSMAHMQRECIAGSRFGRSGAATTTAIQAVFDRLGPASRLLRFGGAKNVLLPSDLELLARVDANHHVLSPPSTASRSGSPGSSATAQFGEVAFAVADDWQQRGIGTLLIERLAADARAAGIESFRADIAPSNGASLALMRRLKLQAA